MKRGFQWSDEEDDDSASSDDSSTVDLVGPVDNTDRISSGNSVGKGNRSSKFKASKVDSAKITTKDVDFEALSRHGYKGGLSVLRVPPPKEPEQEQDWTWSTGKETQPKELMEESFAERQKTRAAVAQGEQLPNVQTHKDRKNLSYQQKEKRKRDLGQASRGKNYVEEEKRTLRESGIYSGFDS